MWSRMDRQSQKTEPANYVKKSFTYSKDAQKIAENNLEIKRSEQKINKLEENIAMAEKKLEELKK